MRKDKNQRLSKNYPTKTQRAQSKPEIFVFSVSLWDKEIF